MFEDSTFESTGRIRTRSRGWMLAAFLFNGSILVALVLIPLIYPEALPSHMLSILLEAPPPPPQQPPAVKPIPVHATRERTEMPNGQIMAPPIIPPYIRMIPTAEPPVSVNLAASNLGQGSPEVNASIFQGHSQAPIVHQAITGPVHVPSTLVAGLLIYKTIPVYPPIAKATRREGVVVLQATISKAGSIENLRVVSGEPMLRDAALDAVRNWRYKPYLLNGQPVEVETTVNVIFRLAQ
jgi:periplasmic protein TonB